MSNREPSPNSRATLAAIVVVAVILIAGVWILARLDASQKAQACLESGGRKCAVIDAEKVR